MMSNPQIDEYGDKYWWVNGRLHRLDGPSIEYINGAKEWWVNGELHRIDGPAIEWVNGTNIWYVNGERHRIDGPAIEWVDGDKSWYVDGVELSGPLDLLKHGAKLEDLAEYLTPREIALCQTQK